MIYPTKVRRNPNFDHTKDIFDYIDWILPQTNILQSWLENMATAAKIGEIPREISSFKEEKTAKQYVKDNQRL